MYLAWRGAISVGVIVQYYCLVAAILMVNYARTLAAHRYENEDAELDDIGQLLDSVNLMGGSWLTGLSAPVGLRYHALHHFMPALPYHSLGKVNRALLEELPEGSPYRVAQSASIATALKLLLSSSAARERRPAYRRKS
jgi:fatty acid desaturase